MHPVSLWLNTADSVVTAGAARDDPGDRCSPLIQTTDATNGSRKLVTGSGVECGRLAQSVCSPSVSSTYARKSTRKWGARSTTGC